MYGCAFHWRTVNNGSRCTWARWKSGSGGSFCSLLEVTSSLLSFCSREKVPSGMKSSMLWSKLNVWRLVILCKRQWADWRKDVAGVRVNWAELWLRLASLRDLGLTAANWSTSFQKTVNFVRLIKGLRHQLAGLRVVCANQTASLPCDLS